MADMWFSHRQWVAIWRGHRIRVRMHRAKIFVELDDKEIFVQKNGLVKKNYEQEWEHPALGSTNILIEKVTKGSDGIDLNMCIGDEIIPLTEIKRTWYGKINPQDAQTYWERLLPAQIESLGDPRWIAASKILNLVRQSSASTDIVRQNANTLQKELRRCFETKQRLGTEDLSLLGSDERLEKVQNKIEENIEQALEAVKSLHMAVVSIEAHADEKQEMRRVQTFIEHIQAQEEIDVALSQAPQAQKATSSVEASSKTKLQKHQMQKNRQDKKL